MNREINFFSYPLSTQRLRPTEHFVASRASKNRRDSLETSPTASAFPLNPATFWRLKINKLLSFSPFAGRAVGKELLSREYEQILLINLMSCGQCNYYLKKSEWVGLISFFEDGVIKGLSRIVTSLKRF